MKRNLALLAIMLLLPLSSFAQYSLLGRVFKIRLKSDAFFP